MKKTLSLFLVLTIIIIAVTFFLFMNFHFGSQRNTYTIPSSAYLITKIGDIKVNNEKLNKVPEILSKNSIIETDENSGGTLTLENGIEIGIREYSSLKLLKEHTIKIDKGNIWVRNIIEPYLNIIWNDYNFQIKGETIIKTSNLSGTMSDYIILKIHSGSCILSSGEKKIELNNGVYYRIRDSENIYSYKMLNSPELISPKNSKTFDIREGNDLLLEWKKIKEAKSYNVYVAYNDLFVSEKILKVSKNQLRLNITDFTNSPIYWRITPVDKNKREGKTSKINMFQIKNLLQVRKLWKTPPILKIQEPLTPTGNLVIVKGKTNLGVKLTINNEIVRLDNQGDFTHIVSFSSIGEHTITIIAENISGAKTKITKDVLIYEK